MPHYFAALTVILLIGMVLTRVVLMNRQGIKVVKFGNIDKRDFLIPPFALFYFYIIFAESFPLPAVSSQEFFRSDFFPFVPVVLDYYSGASCRSDGVFVSVLIPTGLTGL